MSVLSKSLVAAGLAVGFAFGAAHAAESIVPPPSDGGDLSMISQEAVRYCTDQYNACYHQTGDAQGCNQQYQQCLDYYRNSDPYGYTPKEGAPPRTVKPK